MMEGVIERGTGRAVASVGKPLAGKTGTTNESNDTWFVGFSPDLAVGVFVGFDQPEEPRRARDRRHRSPRRSSAISWAAALKDKPAIPFRIPPGIDMVRVDAATGQLAQGRRQERDLRAVQAGHRAQCDAPVRATVGR